MTATALRPAEPIRRYRRRIGSAVGGLVLPAVVFAVFITIVPVVIFLFQSVHPAGSWDAGVYDQLLHNTGFMRVLWRTVLISLLATVIALVIGYPVALAMTRVRGAVRALVLTAVALPYLTSVLVRVFAWSAALSVHGPVAHLLLALGVPSSESYLGNGMAGTLIGIVHILAPIGILTMWGMMVQVKSDLQSVAMSLGGSRIRAFWTVVFPQTVPGLLAAATLIYMLAVGSYPVPAALGGGSGLMFGQLIVSESTTLLDWPLAAAMTVALLLAVAVVAVALIVLRRSLSALSRRRRSSTTGPIATRLTQVGGGIWRAISAVPAAVWTVSFRAFTTLVLLFLVAPEVLVIVMSFNPPGYLAWPPKPSTLAEYEQFFQSPEWTQSLVLSAWIALAASAIAVLLGGLAAYGLARMSAHRFAMGATALIAMPLIIPEIVNGISYSTVAIENGFYGTPLTIILAHAALGTPLVAVVARSSIKSAGQEVELAAMTCGAPRWRVLIGIVAPIVLPSLIVGWLFAYLTSFDNLIISLFAAGANETLPMRMWLSMQDTVSPLLAVVATIMIVVVLVAFGLVTLIGRLTRGNTSLMALTGAHAR